MIELILMTAGALAIGFVTYRWIVRTDASPQK